MAHLVLQIREDECVCRRAILIDDVLLMYSLNLLFS